jgi:hypothetical protein
VFPVRYELNSYILFRRNSVFKGLSKHGLRSGQAVHRYASSNAALVDTQAALYNGKPSWVTSLLSA